MTNFQRLFIILQCRHVVTLKNRMTRFQHFINHVAMWACSNTQEQNDKLHKIRKAFSKFYYRHSELIVKYNIGLKTLLQQGISEPIFYGDLVYKFKRIVGKPNFSDQFKKIVKRYIRVGYNLDTGYHATVCMSSFKPNHGL